MLLTVSTTHAPATDLGYLLHKSPGRLHTASLPFGDAHVFYPEADEHRCTAALLVEVDAVSLARGHRDSPLAAYVSDRPYAASSFLSVALSRVFGTALSGRSRERPELAATPIPLRATVSAVAPRGGERLARALFEPLGWSVTVTPAPLDAEHPEWGDGRVARLALDGVATAHDLLSHLYVLLPALDNSKHYYVGEEEVAKLLRHGDTWLASHPERELIARRYLKHRASLVRLALEQLAPDADDERDDAPSTEEAIEAPLLLDARRRRFVREALEATGARRVADLGCGEGKLTAELARERWTESVVGLDVHALSLERASERVARLPEHSRRKVTLLTGSLVYRDARLNELDAVACVEVIEHLEPERVDAFSRALFGAARPKHVVVTTPNREHNALFPSLPAGRFRHADHRFEWTRAEHEAWAREVAARHGYNVRFDPVGDVHPELGPPTQASVFTRSDLS